MLCEKIWILTIIILMIPVIVIITNIILAHYLNTYHQFN